jgi:hypothetical protein
MSGEGRRLRSKMEVRCRIAIALACASLTLLGSARASAQYSGEPDTDWRRTPRRHESHQRWAFELRIGPYRPKIDDEFSNGKQPFKQVFGDGSHLYFGVELDWQALRIPHVGTLGPGVGWGYTTMSALAKLSGTSTDSAENTSLWIMPMYLAGVARIDALAREWSIPIVPYAKFGMGYALWRTSNDLGMSHFDNISGKGHAYGLHIAGGAALQLDFLDAEASGELENAAGINHSYVYVEWVYSNLGALHSGEMHVGTSSWVTGLAFEM